MLRDVGFLRKALGMTQNKMKMILHHEHKRFAFSYSRIFFSTVRGEMDGKMLRSLLQLKSRLDRKEISLDKAREGVIDGAKNKIARNPEASRKPPTPGSTTQEVIVKCKPDDAQAGQKLR